MFPGKDVHSSIPHKFYPLKILAYPLSPHSVPQEF